MPDSLASTLKSALINRLLTALRLTGRPLSNVLITTSRASYIRRESREVNRADAIIDGIHRAFPRLSSCLSSPCAATKLAQFDEYYKPPVDHRERAVRAHYNEGRTLELIKHTWPRHKWPRLLCTNDARET